MSDAEAVEQLVDNRYFQPHITPVQVFNRATDPFMPRVKAQTFAVLEDLDRRGLRNHVLVITHYRVTPEDCALSRIAHATVFTGLFYRTEIAEYYRDNGLPEPYNETARRKIVPEKFEQRILDAFAESKGGPLFRKTSCAVSFVHGLSDYNGHYGLRDELCDICPLEQLTLCAQAHRRTATASHNRAQRQRQRRASPGRPLSTSTPPTRSPQLACRVVALGGGDGRFGALR
ncbi:MAG: hypothetical protein ACRDQ4_24295 [Pseudonocardiaceae bacterium]